MDYIYLVQLRDQWQAVLNSSDPSRSIKYGGYSKDLAAWS